MAPYKIVILFGSYHHQGVHDGAKVGNLELDVVELVGSGLQGAAARGGGVLAELVHDPAPVIGAGAEAVEAGHRHREGVHLLEAQLGDEVLGDGLGDLGLHVQGHRAGDVDGVGHVAGHQLDRVVLVSGCRGKKIKIKSGQAMV